MRKPLKTDEERAERVFITMNPSIIAELDNACKQYGVTRSAYITFAVKQKIQTDSALVQMPEMLQTLKNAVKAAEDADRKP